MLLPSATLARKSGKGTALIAVFLVPNVRQRQLPSGYPDRLSRSPLRLQWTRPQGKHPTRSGRQSYFARLSRAMGSTSCAVSVWPTGMSREKSSSASSYSGRSIQTSGLRNGARFSLQKRLSSGMCKHCRWRATFVARSMVRTAWVSVDVTCRIDRRRVRMMPSSNNPSTRPQRSIPRSGSFYCFAARS